MARRGRPARFGPRISVSLTSHDYDILSALADKGEVSVSWVVRRAIEDYLEAQRHEVEGELALRPLQEREIRTADKEEFAKTG